MIVKGYRNKRLVFLDDKELTPGESLKLIRHSPDGFNWGYSGSGPAQLALALMIAFIGKENATKYYQKFKTDVISKLPREADFILDEEDIKIWMEENIHGDIIHKNIQ